MPAFGQHVDHLAGERARVDLDGEFGVGAEIEGLAQERHQVAEQRRRHDGRRAAAEMQMDDRQPSCRDAR